MLIAGIDEAGRGALAGPVVAAAVIFDKKQDRSIFKDSKVLTPQKRYQLYDIIWDNALAVGIGLIDNRRIDKVNILQATFLAMKKALKKLKYSPDIVLVDGHLCIPDLEIKQKTVIKGDRRVPVISAASIIAKVARDRVMKAYGKVFDGYLFDQHKGYGTQKHIERIYIKGYSPIHRRTFNISKQLKLF